MRQAVAGGLAPQTVNHAVAPNHVVKSFAPGDQERLAIM